MSSYSYNPDERITTTSTNTEEFSIPEAIVRPYDFDPKNVPLTDLKSLGETLAKVDTDDAKRICELINLYNNQPNNTLLLIELISHCNAYDVTSVFPLDRGKIIAETIAKIRTTAIEMVRASITSGSSASSPTPAGPRLFSARNTPSVPKTTEQKLNDFIKEHLIDPLEKGKTLPEIMDSFDDYIKFKLFVCSRISLYHMSPNTGFEFSILRPKVDVSQSIRQLKDEGFTVGELRMASLSPYWLKAAFSLKDLKAGFVAWELSLYFPASELRDAGFNAIQLSAAGFSIDQLKNAGFSASQLREAINENGVRIFSDDDILHAGFDASELREAGFSIDQLKKATNENGVRIFSYYDIFNAGFSPRELREAGFSAWRLREEIDYKGNPCFADNDILHAGFSARQLGEAGFYASQLEKAGYTASELREAINENGVRIFSDDDILHAGFDARQLREARFSARDLKKAGFSIDQLKKATNENGVRIFSDDQILQAGFDAWYLREAGFSAHQLKKATNENGARIFSDDDILQAGFGARDLRLANFSAHQLKEATDYEDERIFSYYDIFNAGFPLSELIKAGFDARELKKATNENGERIFSDDKILHAGFPARQLKDAGFSLSELIKAGFSARQLRIADFTARQLKDAINENGERIFSDDQILQAGFSARKLKEAINENNERIFSNDQILHAGFDASQLKDAGFYASQLEKAGYTASELRAAGFPANQFIDAGYSISQLKDAGYTVYELLSCFTIDDLKAADFTDAEIDTGRDIYVSILELIQNLLEEFGKKHCLVRCIDRLYEEIALLFKDKMALLREEDPEKAELLKKQYTFRCASFIAQDLPFLLYHHGLFALYSNKSELARLAGRSTPFWGKRDLGSDNKWLIKNGSDPLTLMDPYFEGALETSSIENYIADLRKSKPENIDMPETLGNFKIENLLAIGIYVDGLDRLGRGADLMKIRKGLDNVKDFYEFLMSKGFYVPLTIYTQDPGELETFTDWKSFEYAVLADIRRLEH